MRKAQRKISKMLYFSSDMKLRDKRSKYKKGKIIDEIINNFYFFITCILVAIKSW